METAKERYKMKIRMKLNAQLRKNYGLDMLSGKNVGYK